MTISLNRDRTLRFEFILVDVVRNPSGTLILKFECRFRSSVTSKARLISCSIDLSFSTPESPTNFVIAARPILDPSSDQGIEVTHTKSCGAMLQASLSYFASLRARATYTSTKKYSVTEKETREGGIQGLHGVDLRFHENRELKRGLNGDMNVSVQIDGVEGLTVIHCILSASLRYTLAHTFGFMTSHLERVQASFMLVLQ